MIVWIEPIISSPANVCRAAREQCEELSLTALVDNGVDL